ncbi:type IV pilus assembly protein PilM [Candidatus Curtissbacteria bacterium]|nr:type IV pilus assembly protein PilM [Candidatus Curtissbacteria bacterium]
MAARDFFGLDIGTYSIKIVQLNKKTSPFELVGAGTIPTPAKSLMSESSADQEVIAESIKRLHKELRLRTSYCVVALSESQIFTRVVEMPNINQKEINSSVKWEAEQYVPIPLSEVRLDWQILNKVSSTSSKETKVEVLLVAAPLIIIDKYLKVLKLAEFYPLALETEITSVARSLVQRTLGAPTTLTISIGAATTDLCIVRGGQISFTRSIATGGNALTRSVANDLGFEINQAEEYMKTYGLDVTKLEGKVTAAIKPVFDIVINEIRRAIAYYIGHRPDDPIKRVVVTGGVAKLPGLVVHLANTLGLEVQIGNPWEGIKLPANSGQKLIDNSTTYAVAVGLALKEI